MHTHTHTHTQRTHPDSRSRPLGDLSYSRMAQEEVAPAPAQDVAVPLGSWSAAAAAAAGGRPAAALPPRRPAARAGPLPPQTLAALLLPPGALRASSREALREPLGGLGLGLGLAGGGGGVWRRWQPGGNAPQQAEERQRQQGLMRGPLAHDGGAPGKTAALHARGAPPSSDAAAPMLRLLGVLGERLGVAPQAVQRAMQRCA